MNAFLSWIFSYRVSPVAQEPSRDPGRKRTTDRGEYPDKQNSSPFVATYSPERADHRVQSPVATCLPCGTVRHLEWSLAPTGDSAPD